MTLGFLLINNSFNLFLKDETCVELVISEVRVFKKIERNRKLFNACSTIGSSSVVGDQGFYYAL